MFRINIESAKQHLKFVIRGSDVQAEIEVLSSYIISQYFKCNLLRLLDDKKDFQVELGRVYTGYIFAEELSPKESQLK